MDSLEFYKIELEEMLDKIFTQDRISRIHPSRDYMLPWSKLRTTMTTGTDRVWQYHIPLEGTLQSGEIYLYENGNISYKISQLGDVISIGNLNRDHDSIESELEYIANKNWDTGPTTDEFKREPWEKDQDYWKENIDIIRQIITEEPDYSADGLPDFEVKSGLHEFEQNIDPKSLKVDKEEDDLFE